jgi:hypothetical protein
METDNYKKSLKVGEKFELKILNKIKEKYPKAYKKNGYHPDYDIYVPEVEKSIEVKNDCQGIKSDNIAIETHKIYKKDFKVENSGLMASKSNFFVYGISGENEMWFKTNKLKEHIIDLYSSGIKKVICMGDKGSHFFTYGILVKICSLKEYIIKK